MRPRCNTSSACLGSRPCAVTTLACLDSCKVPCLWSCIFWHRSCLPHQSSARRDMAQQSGSVSPANRPKTPAICYSNPRDKPLNPRAPHFAHSSPQSVSASAGTPAPSRSSTQSQLHSGLERYRSQTASNTMGRGLASAGQSGPPPNAPTGPRLPNVKARTVAVISRSQSGPPLNAPTGPRHRNVQAMPTQALGRSRPTPKGLASVNVASVSAGLSTRVLNGPAPANQRQIQYVIRVREAMRLRNMTAAGLCRQ